ncbi:MAG TPA: phosphoglucosamine mutase [Elusimicrobiota bacterium]|nr:phosphoglucosamine mutase [Elusimicrobiota bacterium]
MRKLFGTDGIRGVAGTWPLTPEFVRRLGVVAAKKMRGLSGKPACLVVRDTRRSGPGLQKALTRGLSAGGLRVYDGGVLPTPAVSALVPRHGFCAGAVLSASHNPAEFNGIKFFGPSGTKLPDALELAMERELPVSPGRMGAVSVPAGSAASSFIRAEDEYLGFLRSAWPLKSDLSGLRLVMDGANGATHRVAGRLFRSLGAEVSALAVSPNGWNINRDCGTLHPQRLAREVLRRRAHVGVAFDGDGDRAMFVDERGRVCDGDAVLLVTSRALKARGRLKKNLVAITVMSNLGLKRAFSALDIDIVETPVGDRYVWQALRDTGAVLGGEPSGHVIFREFLPTGDGLLTALQVLAVLRSSGSPLSALTSLFVRYPQVLVNVKVREKRPLESVRPFWGDVQTVKKSLGEDGRIFVRYSGTEPLLRIMMEGPSQDRIRGYADSLVASARRAGLASS